MLIITPQSPKLFVAVPEKEWREPSLFVPKDQFGNPVKQTRFRLRGRLNDGHVKFALWFDSRDDWEEFSWSLAQYVAYGVPIPREDWHLPNEIWGDPTLYPELNYDFATVTFLTSTPGSNQTWTVPSDWNNGQNTVELIAGGGSGGANNNNAASARNATGGAGAGYGMSSNLTLAVGASITYRIGSGGVAVSDTDAGSTGLVNGNAGGDSWFDGTTYAGSATGALGGPGGNAANGTASAVTGLGGKGTLNRTGGNAASAAVTGANRGVTGGGGAAGPSANGSASTGVSGASSQASAGGNSGGGATGGAGSTAGASNAGANGTDWDATHGSGAGGGGSTNAGAATAGVGGNYGGASGGVVTNGSGNATGSAGAQGIVVVTYTPALSSMLMVFN